MKKQLLILCALFALFGAEAVFAQDNANLTFGLENDLGTSLGFTSDFKSGLGLDLMAEGEGGQKAPFGGIGPVAGLINMPLGLWSWLHKDWVGGAVTVGLFGGGVAFMFSGNPFLMLFPGIPLIIASPIYGFVRGWTHFNRLKAASLAEAMSDNPLNHISLIAFPTLDDRTAAGLAYSVSF